MTRGTSRSPATRSTTCLITPNSRTDSEPFIRAHIERLPGPLEVLHGGWPYLYDARGRPVISPTVRLRDRLLRRAFAINPEHLWSLEPRRPGSHDAALHSHLRRHGVACVLAEYGPTGVAVMDACIEADIPLVVQFFGYDVYDREACAFAGTRYPELFDASVALIAHSRYMARELVALGAPLAKVHVNPCGVDVDRLGGCAPGEAPPVFIAVARFVDKKAPELTLLAFRDVAVVRREARLVFVGDGPLLEAARRLTRGLGISDQVEFLGARNHDDLPDLYRRSRAFLQHSLRTATGDSEGMPVAILEASASGLPIVSTRHDGIPEAVLDGETGLLVDEGDVQAMADRMLRLVDDPAFAAKLGAAGARYVRERFSLDHTIGMLARIVTDAAGRGEIRRGDDGQLDRHEADTRGADERAPEPKITSAPDRLPYLVYGSPQLLQPEIDEVVETLRSGWIGTGRRVLAFERAFAAYVGAPHAIAVNSCTAGLHLSLRVLGLRPGDEVIVPAMTFAATANAVVNAGGTPVFADVDRSTMCLDAEDAARRITDRTVAIIPVHFAGRACDMDAIVGLAKAHTLRVIEDCAHAVETLYRGSQAGTIGELGSFSFYVTKNVTTGEGGMVTTANDEWAARIKTLGLHGLSADAWKRFSDEGYRSYEVVEPGFKYNMTDLQAALGLHQLERVERNLLRRCAIWQRYDAAFADLPVLTPAPEDEGTRHGRHLYTLLLEPERSGCHRDEVQRALHLRGIGTGIHYQALHLHRYYRETFGHRAGDLPNAEWISERTLSLPLSPKLTDADVGRIVVAVSEIVEGSAA